VCTTPTDYGFGDPSICLKDVQDSNTYCHHGCRDDADCPAGWTCDYSFIQSCQDANNCAGSATCEVVTHVEDDQTPPADTRGKALYM